MIRIIAALAGIVFAGVALLAFFNGAYTALTEEPQHSADHEFHLDAHGPEGGFSFDGPAGNWDIAQLQRGLRSTAKSARRATASSSSPSATSKSLATARHR